MLKFCINLGGEEWVGRQDRVLQIGAAQTVIRRVPCSRFSDGDSTTPWLHISTDALESDNHRQSSRSEYFFHVGKIRQLLLAR
jgi:hypothetical protein